MPMGEGKGQAIQVEFVCCLLICIIDVWTQGSASAAVGDAEDADVNHHMHHQMKV